MQTQQSSVYPILSPFCLCVRPLAPFVYHTWSCRNAETRGRGARLPLFYLISSQNPSHLFSHLTRIFATGEPLTKSPLAFRGSEHEPFFCPHALEPMPCARCHEATSAMLPCGHALLLGGLRAPSMAVRRSAPAKRPLQSRHNHACAELQVPTSY